MKAYKLEIKNNKLYNKTGRNETRILDKRKKYYS